MSTKQNVNNCLHEVIIQVQSNILIDTYVYLPSHCFNFVYLCVLLISLLLNQHIQPRPKKLFVFSCASYILAQGYNLLTDITYLLLIGQQMTIQQCSTLRNFLMNPLAAQGLVDAADRFIVIFGYGTLDTLTISLLYIAFPLGGVVFFFVNTYLSAGMVEDEVCGFVRRSSWTIQLMFGVQWFTTIVAFVLYFLIYRKITKHFGTRLSNSGSLSQERYYKDRSIISLFLVCCAIPALLATPSALIYLVEVVFGASNKVISLVGSVLLDLAIPSIWTAYLAYIPSVRRGLTDLFMDVSFSKPATITKQVLAIR